jgi:NSS family neurotransmitter:Na+ symporter
LFVGWIWHRNNLLKEISAGHPEIEQSLFWRIWPSYVKVFCPVLIAATFLQSVLA